MLTAIRRSIYTPAPVSIYSHTFWLLLRDIIFDNVHVDAFFSLNLALDFFEQLVYVFLATIDVVVDVAVAQSAVFFFYYFTSFRRVWLPSERCRCYCRCHRRRHRFLWRDVACAGEQCIALFKIRKQWRAMLKIWEHLQSNANHHTIIIRQLPTIFTTVLQCYGIA